MENEQDIYELLASKENDIILAANFGRALLDKNEALSRDNERMAEDYGRNLEKLEQEKYKLRRKVSSLNSEFDSQILFLQNENKALKAKLEKHATSDRDNEREKSKIIADLTEQNQRLTRQLKDAIRNEEDLNVKLQQLRTQQDIRRSKMSTHETQIDMLKEEVTVLHERNAELDRRLAVVSTERDQSWLRCESTLGDLATLERANAELKQKLSAQDHTRQSRDSAVCEERCLHTPFDSPLFSLGEHHHSLLAEVESYSTEDEGVHSGSNYLSPHTAVLGSSGYTHSSSHNGTTVVSDSVVNCHTAVSLCDMSAAQLRAEVCQSLRHVRSLTECLQGEQTSPAAPADLEQQAADQVDRVPGAFNLTQTIDVRDVKGGMLVSACKQALSTLQVMLSTRHRSCDSCGRDSLLQIEVDLHTMRERYDELERRHNEGGCVQRRQAEEISRLCEQVKMLELSNEALAETRDILRDDLNSVTQNGTNTDELVQKAWMIRDEAVSRKNQKELELAQTRVEMMQINTQLIECIEKKVELSCQLDQWQAHADLQQLIEDQVREKLSKADARTPATGGMMERVRRQNRSILKLFSRPPPSV